MAPLAGLTLLTVGRRLATRSNDPQWYLGLVLELIGTLVNLLGKQSLRYASITGQRRFIALGFVLWALLYPACDLTALHYAPSSVVAAIDGMIVVWNIFAAPYTLGEPVTTSRLTAAAVITVGTVGAGLFGSHSETNDTAAAYLEQWSKPGAIVYYFVLVSVAVTAWLMSRRTPPTTLASGFWQGARQRVPRHATLAPATDSSLLLSSPPR